MNELIYGSIKLHPTEQILDVIICDDIRLVKLKYMQLYRGAINIKPNIQGLVKQVDGNILMILVDYSEKTLIHEAVHVTWELSKIIQTPWEYETQELQAYYVDYIVREVKNIKHGLLNIQSTRDKNNDT